MLAFEAGSELLWVGQERIDCPELLLDSGLSSSFWHALAALSLTIPVPLMVRAVDLNEFAKTVAAIAWLIDLRLASSMRNPETVGNHPVTYGFYRDRYLVAFAELFCG